MLVTFSEFSLLKGCTKAAVTYAVKSRIAAAVVEKDGKRWLDRDLALGLWNRNTLRNNSAKVSQPDAVEPVAAPRPARTRAEVEKRLAQLPDDAIPELNESRARREHYQAELAKLEVDHRRSELVATDAVKKEAFNVAKTVREALINIPDRVANLLAAETDASAIHMALTTEITQALEGLVNA